MNTDWKQKLKNSGIVFSVGTLNFLANVGLMLPYILILSAYHESAKINFLIALIIFYIARAGSIFYTKRFNLTSMTYLILSVLLGATGSFIYAATTNIYVLGIGSILWGYSAAIIWPYFLTVKLHISDQSDFSMKRVHWLVFLCLGILFGIDILTKTNYAWSFLFLGLLYLVALPGCLLLNNFVSDFQPQHGHIKPFIRTWRTGLFLIFFGILAVLTTLRKTSYTLPVAVLLLLIGASFVILIAELYADRKVVAGYKLELINRGFLSGFVLLFNGFLAQFILGKSGMYAVFAVYLISFELGNPIFNRLSQKKEALALKYSQMSLLAGHLLLLIPTKVTYILGLLGISLYIGYDNPILNRKLYAAEEDSDRAIVHKYRFSTYGGLFCQLFFFAILIVVSRLNQLPLLHFFTPDTFSHRVAYFYGVGWPLTLISLGISIWNARSMQEEK